MDRLSCELGQSVPDPARATFSLARLFHFLLGGVFLFGDFCLRNDTPRLPTYLPTYICRLVEGSLQAAIFASSEQ
jgi:hypothetical protein